MTPFRGLILGWYHQRNAGDDRLAHCIERWLHDHQLTFWSHTQTPSAELLSRCDYVILGGGSLANAHHGAFFGMRKWITAAKIPVFGAGLTVSSIPALREEFKAIPESGGLIWVRDQESADFLKLPSQQCITAPDLSWLFPLTGDHFGLESTARSGVAVNFRPWPKRNWNPRNWSTPIADLKGAVPYPLCFGRDDDRPVLREVFGARAPEFRSLQDDAEFDPTRAARAELVVAMRFHAILFAIQSGTPFLALGNSRKLQWMLDGLDLGEYVVPIEDPEKWDAKLALARSMDSGKLLGITARQKALAWETANTFKTRIEEQAGEAKNQRARNQNRLGTRVKRRLLRVT
ncbi:MAG TPA: polysaccharide pyruvyl transferase family protein [Abditibacterium sp.]|jgi:polysaccharide pyruvyl transferase WcaK-like protein